MQTERATNLELQKWIARGTGGCHVPAPVRLPLMPPRQEAQLTRLTTALRPRSPDICGEPKVRTRVRLLSALLWRIHFVDPGQRFFIRA